MRETRALERRARRSREVRVGAGARALSTDGGASNALRAVLELGLKVLQDRVEFARDRALPRGVGHGRVEHLSDRLRQAHDRGSSKFVPYERALQTVILLEGLEPWDELLERRAPRPRVTR